MHVAELLPGDIFGEMSVMYRNKCVANVKAIQPLEVITIHRNVWMRVLHHHKSMMEAFKQLIVRRRKENQYLRFGRASVVKTTGTIVAASRLNRAFKRRLAWKKEVAGLAAENEGVAASEANGNAKASVGATPAVGAAPAVGEPAVGEPAAAPAAAVASALCSSPSEDGSDSSLHLQAADAMADSPASDGSRTRLAPALAPGPALEDAAMNDEEVVTIGS
eukprot:1038901-Prymnesium_polylepis.1